MFRPLLWAPSDVQVLSRGSSQVLSCSWVLAVGYLTSQELSLLEPNLGMKELNPTQSIEEPAWPLRSLPEH